MSGSVIDQLWVALGIKAEGDGLRDVKHQVNEAKESLLSAGDAVKAFFAGFAVHEVAKIGSTFEQNSIQIAGFLSALGQSSDFNQGLQDAAGVIQQITKDAARLPGEADEYIEVFKAGFPFVKAAMPGGSLKDMTDFTNQLTAIGKTFGLDAGLIAREFDHMLSAGKGQASLRLPLFRQLMAFMRHVPGQAKLTAESFNAMTAPQRLQLLQATFAQLQPMLDASATSFDAMWGAAVSAVKQMTRFATVPLFKAMKQGLDQFNSMFYDDAGKLTAFGQKVVDGLNRAIGYMTQFLQMGAHMLKWFVQTGAGATSLKVVLGLLGAALTGLAVEKTVGTFTRLLSVLTNVKSLLMGGLFAAIALVVEDLYQFETGGDSVTGMLLERFPRIKEFASDLLDILTDLFGLFYDEDKSKSRITALKESLEEAKPAIIAAAVAIGIALAAAFAPITTTLTAITALSVMANQIVKKKGFFYERLSAAGKGIGRAVGAQIPEDVDMGGAGVLAANPAAGGWAPNLGWSPADNAAPSPLLTPPTAATNHTVIHNTINIKSTDPAGAAKEVTREQARNAQSKVKM